jgi:aflatoxin B1 aldehyde reductase
MGKTAGGFVRNTDLSECQSILDAYLKYGHREIDTALNYGGGSTQEYLAKLDLKGSTVDTK